MCVAIVVPAGIDIPSFDILEKCWDINPDGAGFAFYNKDKNLVEFHKGFMLFDDFKHAIKTLKMNEKNDVTRFLHFRITSAGETVAGNTHPFPIVTNIKDMSVLDGLCPNVMMHNGTFNLVPSTIGASDTMELARIIAETNIYKDGFINLCKMLTPLVGSNKLAFMDKAGAYHLVGEWSENDGVFYSNTYWKYEYSTIKSGWLYPESYYTYKDDSDEDDSMITLTNSDEEDEALKHGKCPCCGGSVSGPVKNGHDNMYECFECNTKWLVYCK